MSKRRLTPPVPKEERSVVLADGISVSPGSTVTIGKKKVRVDDDGRVRVKGLMGWKDATVRRSNH